jgi:hypothetical protein
MHALTHAKTSAPPYIGHEEIIAMDTAKTYAGENPLNTPNL